MEEFDELMGAQEVQEIVLGKDSSTDPLSEVPPENEKIAELRAKLLPYPDRTASESLTLGHVSEWSGSPEGAHPGI